MRPGHEKLRFYSIYRMTTCRGGTRQTMSSPFTSRMYLRQGCFSQTRASVRYGSRCGHSCLTSNAVPRPPSSKEFASDSMPQHRALYMRADILSGSDQSLIECKQCKVDRIVFMIGLYLYWLGSAPWQSFCSRRLLYSKVPSLGWPCVHSALNLLRFIFARFQGDCFGTSSAAV